MTPQEAIDTLEALRKSVLSIVIDNKPSPISGAGHDNIRTAVETLREAIKPKEESKP